MKELVPDDDPAKGLGDFFDFLWGQQNGYVYLPNKNRDLPKEDPESWQKAMFEWPKNRSDVIKYTLAVNAKGHDVYVAPAIFSERSPKKENVKGSYFCWVDFDGNAPEAWPSTVAEYGPPAAPDALNALEGAAPSPTLRISSSQSGHEHVYWRFDSFQTDTTKVENISRGLAYKYKGDTGGWDIGQVLRPPYTDNHKTPVGKPVKIVASTEHEYGLERFSSFAQTRQVVPNSIELGEIPTAEEVIALYPWDKHNFELFMKTQVEEGKRSSALMALGFFGAESGMKNEEIYAILDSADKRWGKFTGRPNRDFYLLDIIGKARKKYPVGAHTAETALRGLLGSNEDITDDPKYVFGFDDFNKLEINVDWIIEGLLERAGMVLVASAPGIGKTQFSLQFALCCALGEPFIKWKITKPMRILWFSLEMNAPALQYFTLKMAGAYDEDQTGILNENLKIIPMGEVLPLDHPEGQKFLEALIEEYKPDGIILDSMGKVTNESLADEKKAKELNAYYAKIRKRHDVFMWFVHHNRKANGDNKKPKELSDIYGNQYLSADLTSALSLWREPGNTEIDLNVIKTRLGPEQPTIVIKRNEYLLFTAEQVIADSILDSPLASGERKDGENENSNPRDKGQGGVSADFSL